MYCFSLVSRLELLLVLMSRLELLLVLVCKLELLHFSGVQASIATLLWCAGLNCYTRTVGTALVAVAAADVACS